MVMSEAGASLSGARVSPQKARLVVDQIRGKSVSDALLILSFSLKKSSGLIKKLLESAMANAEHNNGLDVDELCVSSISVGQATTLKRMRPRAKGRSDRILKRSCHITVTLSEQGVV